MDDASKAKLITNIKASPKMLSVQAAAVFSFIGAAVLAYLQTMSDDQIMSLVTTILAHWGWSAAPLLPVVGFAIRYYLRVKPQPNLTPAEAEAKSAEPSAPDASGGYQPAPGSTPIPPPTTP